MKIIYYVHGTTTDNASGKCSGWKNVELNELGIEQATNLGINTPYKFDILFTSDLKRAVTSAQYAFPDFEIQKDKRLRECNYGSLDGQDKKIINYLDHIDEPFPEGESLKDVEKRIRDFINYLKENYPNKVIGIVAHRATQLSFEVITKNISWEEAINNDWRKTGNWSPGWKYEID